VQAATDADLGRGAGVNFPISCTPSAQTRFNEALAGLHSFWYARRQGIRRHRADRARLRNCVLGVALSLWNQLWAPPLMDALQKGSDAIQTRTRPWGSFC
jgi:hypothetical protein